jgi:hypothetical protein
MSDQKYIEPMILKYRPSVGELITRDTGTTTVETSYDPGAIQAGMEVKKYYESALHPAVATYLEIRTKAPFWSGFHIKEMNDYDRYPGFEAIDKVVIDLLNYQIDRMRKEEFMHVLKGMLYDGLVGGFTIAEKNFKWDGRYQCVDNIKTHSPFNFDIYTDIGFNIDKLYYSLTGTFIEKNDLPKIVIGTYPYVQHGRHYGRSVIQPIHYDVQMIQALENLLTQGIQRLTLKQIIYYYHGDEMSESDVQKKQRALYNADGGAVFAFHCEVDPNRGTAIRGDDIRVLESLADPQGIVLITDYLQILYKRASRILGIPDDLGLTNTNVGSYSKAVEEMNILTLFGITDQEWIENIVNRQIFPSMIQYNYNSVLQNREYKLPEFRLGSLEEGIDSEKAEMYIALLEGGILKDVPEHINFILHDLGLPPLTTEAIQTIDQQEDVSTREMMKKRLLDRVKRKM